ncbi:MAG TPA: response regulator [Pyrinomonadaceae bacterium]|nr:response regulator [Pyrinomonadaceae bacterium]
MKSKRDLLHELTDQNLSISQRAQARCQLARHYEDEGDYEAARVAMSELWRRIGDRPLLEGFDEETKGAVLLRVGVLTGWIGSARQISGAQETAKNLLSESIGIFEGLRENSRVAEAQIDLAYCYWREGAYDEGRVWLRKALSLLTDSDLEIRAKALLRSAIIEADANRPNDALKIHIQAAPLFEQVENHCLQGSFHNSFAIVLRRLGAGEKSQEYFDRALIEYTAAAYHFEKAGHLRYQACVENNLAFLFFEARRYADAHEHLDRADMLFARLKDDVHRAQVDETRARVLLAEDKVVEAEKAARRAVRTLETGDESSLLTEALITLGISLARLQHFGQARLALDRAINTAQQADDVESAGIAALTLIEQLGLQLTNDDLMATLARAEVLLENTQNVSIIRRQAKNASRVAFIINASPKCFPSSIDPAGISAKNETLRYYKHLIALALKQSGGAVKTAARLLGMSHQNLSSKLVQYEELAKFRKPVRTPRRKSIDNSGPSSTLGKGKRTRTVKILLVEDNQLVAGAVSETLESEGWTVERSSDGTSALESISGTAHYDLLLFDHDLPGLNGIELVQKAREMAHRALTPIVMLAASPVEVAAREAGTDVFLQKPQGIGLLVETINRLLVERENKSI